MRKLVAVEGMKCEGCADTVKNKFENLDGIQKVEVDLETKTAFVETERELTVEELNSSLSDTKYEVMGISNA